MIGVGDPLPGVVYPPNEALAHYIKVGALTEETLVGAMMDTFAARRECLAIVSATRSFTYGELDAQSDKLAAGLLDLGLKPLDRALFQIDNCIEFVVAFTACLKAGIIPVATICAHREAEIKAIGRHVEARCHFVQGDHRHDLPTFAGKMRDEIPSMEHIVICRGESRPGAESMENLIASQDPTEARLKIEAVLRDPFQVAVFQLSGGSTGVPKVIPRFQNEYLYNFRAFAERLDYQPSDCLFTAAPLMHNAGVVVVLGPALVVGCRIAVTHETDAESLATVLRECKPTWFPMRGPLMQRLRGVRQSLGDPSRIKGVVSTNAARDSEELFNAIGVQYFGMTEGLIMISSTQASADTRHKTVGTPISPWDEVRLLKPGTEEDVRAGEIGELAVRGPYTIRGYYNSPERDRVVFTSDGFYRSEDLLSAHETDIGTCYRFEGRIKDVVDRAGEKFSCQEVEEALRSNVAVADVAVVPIPDPVYGERACAVVIVQEPHGPIDLPYLARHLDEIGLAKFKWPERLDIVEEFPLTAAGKIDKEAIKLLLRSSSGELRADNGSGASRSK